MTLQNTALGLGVLLLFTLVMTLLNEGNSDPVGGSPDTVYAASTNASSSGATGESRGAGHVRLASHDLTTSQPTNQTSINTAQTSATQSAVPSNDRNNDRARAQQAIDQSDWRLAELHLLRAFEQSRGDVGVVQQMIDVKRQRIETHLKKDEHTSASARVAEAASVLIDLTRNYMSHHSAPTELAAVTEMELNLNKLRRRITYDAIGKADTKIAYALELADEAHWPWYSFQSNDRDEVREALQTLLWVHRRFDHIDDATRGEYFHALTKLKDLVADSEWAPLTASAGFVSKR